MLYIRHSIHLLIWAALACLAATSCNSQTPPGSDALLTISTSHGTMHAVLYDATPQHKANFIKLAKQGFFDSLLFHRVVPQFMIQGGDPTSKNAPAGQPLGQNGPGYTLPAEIVPQYFHERGALAAARKPDQANPSRESDGSQFYIVQGKTFTEQELREMRVDVNKLYQYFQELAMRPDQKALYDRYNALYNAGDTPGLQKLIMESKDLCEKTFNIELDKPLTEAQLKAYTTQGGAPFLDGDYTVFGRLLDGYEVLDKIAAEQRDSLDRPLNNVRILKVKVEYLPKKEIQKRFQYQYPAPK